MIKNIKTRNETKDRNLYVMELLDLETRRLRNEQTKAGLTKYANLAEDFNEEIFKEQENNRLFEDFKKLKGDDITQDMFDDFKRERENQIRIEKEIRLDNEIYLDAEGDDELEMQYYIILNIFYEILFYFYNCIYIIIFFI